MKGLIGKAAIVLVLVAAIGIVLVDKKSRSRPSEAPGVSAPASTAATALVATSAPGVRAATVAAARLPRLLDLGSVSCIPCKMMAPILEQLKKEQAGKLRVDFIDVWKDRAAGEKYGVRAIPCQIFFDAVGKEVWRHEGFLGREDILAKCKELGFALAPGAGP
jgi:thioredoxin 1